MTTHSRVSTCLWFNDDAEEAVSLYTSLVENSRITAVSRYGPEQRVPEGTALTIEFELAGTRMRALNGGVEITPNESASIQIDVESQSELDRIWDALLADGGLEGQCGWVRDRFGFWWQVVPTRLGELMSVEEPGVAQRVMEAMLKMQRLDVAALEAAAASASVAD